MDLPLKALVILSLAFSSATVKSTSIVGVSSTFFLLSFCCLIWKRWNAILISCDISSTFFLIQGYSKSNYCIFLTSVLRLSSIAWFELSSELGDDGVLDGGISAKWTSALTKVLM